MSKLNKSNQPDPLTEFSSGDASSLLTGVRWPSNEMRQQIVPVVDGLCDIRDILVEELELAEYVSHSDDVGYYNECPICKASDKDEHANHCFYDSTLWKSLKRN